ncbi:MAG: flavodoxin family protein [Candidatus Thermoplasmatota archaeon]
MKVTAFNGSSRKDGNTAFMIKQVFKELKKENISTELIQFADRDLSGCKACRKCFEKQDNKCIIDKDDLNKYIQKMIKADGIIIASPTYFSNVTAEMKAFIDRAGYVGFANGCLFKRKVGAAIGVARRAGAIHVFNSLNHFLFIQQMIIPGSTYWNIGIGKDKGDVKEDSEGIKTMKNLGKNMAWTLKKINR